MRRASAFVALVSSLLLLASGAMAAETVKGTITKVDPKAATITFTREGTKKQEVLAVDKSVKLTGVRPSTKAELTVDAGVVKEIKPGPKTGGY